MKIVINVINKKELALFSFLISIISENLFLILFNGSAKLDARPSYKQSKINKEKSCYLWIGFLFFDSLSLWTWFSTKIKNSFKNLAYNF